MNLQFRSLTIKTVSTGSPPAEALTYGANFGADQKQIYFNFPRAWKFVNVETRAHFLRLLGTGDIASGSTDCYVEYFSSVLVLDDLTWTNNPAGTGYSPGNALALGDWNSSHVTPGVALQFLCLYLRTNGLTLRSARLYNDSTTSSAPQKIDATGVEISKEVLFVP